MISPITPLGDAKVCSGSQPVGRPTTSANHIGTLTVSQPTKNLAATTTAHPPIENLRQITPTADAHAPIMDPLVCPASASLVALAKDSLVDRYHIRCGFKRFHRSNERFASPHKVSQSCKRYLEKVVASAFEVDLTINANRHIVRVVVLVFKAESKFAVSHFRTFAIGAMLAGSGRAPLASAGGSVRPLLPESFSRGTGCLLHVGRKFTHVAVAAA